MIVVRAPNPILRTKTKLVKKITPALLQTFKEMVKLTKTFKDPEGVGLASTQIGQDGQYFVAKVDGSARTRKEAGETTHLAGGVENPSSSHLRGVPNEVTNEDKFITVINPKFTWTSKRTKKYFEGCLSIPNYYGEIKRYLSIMVSYQDETGKIVTKPLKGIAAWIFQHEMDHLDGILFPDKVLEQKGKFYKVIGKDKTGTDIFEEVTI